MKKLRYISIAVALAWYMFLIEKSDYVPETNSERWTTILTLTAVIVAIGYGVPIIVQSLRKKRK